VNAVAAEGRDAYRRIPAETVGLRINRSCVDYWSERHGCGERFHVVARGLDGWWLHETHGRQREKCLQTPCSARRYHGDCSLGSTAWVRAFCAEWAQFGRI